jgi:hypothetical protein
MGKRANELKKRKRQNGGTAASQPIATKVKTTHTNGNASGNGNGNRNGAAHVEEDELDDDAEAEFDVDVENAVMVLQDLVEHSEKLMDKRLKALKGAVWDLHRVMMDKAGVGE